MRIWSLHPKYLDSKGLVAVWRETLLAKNVLLGKTKGYKNHPQLLRFKNSLSPIKNIDFYLQIIWEEAKRRNYKFDSKKFEKKERNKQEKIPITTEQLAYEMKHLMNKLQTRDKVKYEQNKNFKTIESHPIFAVYEGEIEDWEKL